MQQVALTMPRQSPTPRVPGWKRTFPDYGKGLDQVIQAPGVLERMVDCALTSLWTGAAVEPLRALQVFQPPAIALGG